MIGDLKTEVVSAVRYASQIYAVPTARARLIPEFLIIGAERAGTTSLYRYLVQHPQVMPLTLGRKGAHYFDTNFEKGVRWYRSHFPSALAAGARARRAGTDRVVTGEGCPYYLFHPLVPQRAHALLPDARLILMLRAPVSRAYSHYQHEVARGFEHLPFEEAIDAEPERLAGEEERLRRDPGYQSFSHQHHSYLARGRYVEQIRRWQAYYPSECMLVIDSTTFFSFPDAGFREVSRFLGLEELSLPGYGRMNARSYGEMPSQMRERLRDHFTEPNRQLERYLGRSFPWAS
jgi:sulfotransferase family protein